MGRLIQIAIVVALGVAGYKAYHRAHLAQQPPAAETAAEFSADDPQPEAEDRGGPAASPKGKYRCDGRTRCGQFHSCDEATWAIENCPGMEMDGDNDGVPCEDHLCPHS
jgi:hypothetical protein